MVSYIRHKYSSSTDISVKKKDSQDMYVKFMEPPLSEEDEKLLADFLRKANVIAPDSWPLLKCRVVDMFGDRVI